MIYLLINDDELIMTEIGQHLGVIAGCGIGLFTYHFKPLISP